MDGRTMDGRIQVRKMYDMFDCLTGWDFDQVYSKDPCTFNAFSSFLMYPAMKHNEC